MALPRSQASVSNNDPVLLLHHAILESHFEEALMQIRIQPLNILTSLHNNASALHLAARQDWLDGVQFLIEQRGIDINLLNVSNESAIHHALRNNHWAVVDYLVKQGANLELCDTQGIGLLSIIASQPANLPALKNLWKQCGANVQKRLLENRNALGKTPLHIAAIQGAVELVQWFVEELQKNHCPAPYVLVDRAGYTPLHEAAQYGYAAVCDYLIALGADPYVLNINGDAPIHLASLNNVAVSLHQKMRVAFPLFEEEVKDDVPHAQNNQLWSEERYRLLQNSLLEKTNFPPDRLQDTQPDDPAAALVLWINSEAALQRADQLARTCIRGNARVPEAMLTGQADILVNTVQQYTSAMTYALAALCHYEKHTPKQYQTAMGQQLLATQAQRVLTHY
ncbi:MAG: ankyrin-like protein, partial [Gammaproteobacteria bacterium]|nr:ankyrin-like protein [Gammaproteobacteria bacterium]